MLEMPRQGGASALDATTSEVLTGVVLTALPVWRAAVSPNITPVVGFADGDDD